MYQRLMLADRRACFPFLTLVRLCFFVFSGSVLLINAAQAHPMDLGVLKIQSTSPGNERISIDLRLHQLAVEQILSSRQPLTAQNVFDATIALQKPKLDGIDCDFLSPTLMTPEPDFIDLQTHLVCRNSPELQLTWKLPFLSKMSPVFQLMIQLISNGPSGTSTAISTLSRDQNTLKIGSSTRTFFGFVHMGMAHIGVSTEEWLTEDGKTKIAEGLDHIFFVLALVLAGRGTWNLLKTVSGFTLGHSMTLALTMFQIIHVHSRWIEVGIAASIAFVAARAFLFKGAKAENWIIAAVFGAIHGLGFSTALRDLELPTSQILPALIGFNVGVEIGQAVLILLLIGILWYFRNHDRLARQLLSAALFLIGSYWTFIRFFG